MDEKFNDMEIIKFMGHSPAYWEELDAHARALEYDKLIEEIVVLKIKVQLLQQLCKIGDDINKNVR